MPWYVWVAIGALALLLLLLVYLLFFLRPGRRRAATAYFLDFHYAHRGLHGDGLPENSMAAFEAACRAGYGIELDVRISRDGVPMVFHDETLTRVCGIDRKIGEFTAAELERTPLQGNPAHTIPRLADVLSLVRGRVPLCVEIKHEQGVRAVCEPTAALLDGYRGAYCIESFNPMAVKWFRENRPLVVRGQLSEQFWRRKNMRNLPTLAVGLLLTNFLCRPDFISFNVKHRRSLPFRLATRLFGAAAFAWTVKTVEEEAESYGYFDALIFEGIRPQVGVIDD